MRLSQDAIPLPPVNLSMSSIAQDPPAEGYAIVIFPSRSTQFNVGFRPASQFLVPSLGIKNYRKIMLLKKNRTYLISFLMLFLLSLTNVNGQLGVTSQMTLPTFIPPSPNAASLGKFGDIPVGLYPGIPNISIPLYSLTLGSYSLPISLGYHSSGMKVEELSSWIWSWLGIECRRDDYSYHA